MNNKMLLVGVCVLIVVCNRNSIKNFAWRCFDKQIDNARSLEVGDDFNKISWGDLGFQINHHKDGNNLEYVNVTSKEIYVLLKGISSYKIFDNNLYVKSKNGFAVVDSNNFCRIFLEYPNAECSNDGFYNANGYKVFHVTSLESDKILYLSDYSEFNDDEKNIFDKLR